MKSLKIFALCLTSVFICSHSYGQDNFFSLLDEIDKLEYDIVIAFKNTNTVKNIKDKISLAKKAAEDVHIEYTIQNGLIQNFTFKGNGFNCSSEKFGKFILAIKNGVVAGCSIVDKKE